MNSVLKKYLNKTYSNTFFPIFLTLYMITSIIFLVKIASLTSIIQINILELLELYSYNIAIILFYTIPISLFISLALALAKLSSEYELIVMTSFGLNPLQILKIFLPLLFFSSVLMLIVSLALIPKSSFMKNSFLDHKKVEAQFNIKASEYGQQFGKWLIYVEKKQNGLYQNVVLYQQNRVEDVFIIAKYARLNNMKTSLNLSLNDGKVIKVSQKVTQINFKRMIINNNIKQLKEFNTFQDLVKYWTIKKREFSWSCMFSALPLILSFFILSLGYFNPRYNKNYSVPFSFLIIIIYVIVIKEMSKEFELLALYTLPIILIMAGYLTYRYKIKPHY